MLLLPSENQAPFAGGAEEPCKPSQPYRGPGAGPAGYAAKDAYCTDILIQVSAVNAALNSFSKELLATHIRTCVADGIRRGEDEVIDELVTTLQKLMK